jgi:hypothetical protein
MSTGPEMEAEEFLRKLAWDNAVLAAQLNANILTNVEDHILKI